LKKEGDATPDMTEYPADQEASAMPVKHLNDNLIRSLPDNGPVVMVNLVRFREKSADGNGSGWDAYVRYSEITMRLIKARSGTVLWAGKPEGYAFGEGPRWDYVVLVQYPSRAAFLDMMASPEYALANAHRESGVEDHVILAANQTYAKRTS
jgi:uncharacterized protein (DUF1330 family)